MYRRPILFNTIHHIQCGLVSPDLQESQPGLQLKLITSVLIPIQNENLELDCTILVIIYHIRLNKFKNIYIKI